MNPRWPSSKIVILENLLSLRRIKNTPKIKERRNSKNLDSNNSTKLSIHSKEKLTK